MVQLNIAIHSSDATKCQKEVRQLGKRFAKEITKHIQEIILKRRKRIGIKVSHPYMKFVATTLGDDKYSIFQCPNCKSVDVFPADARPECGNCVAVIETRLIED